ncbi:MAG TPA: sugar transferase [Candidatus Scalindua sp.]|nr:sugar transferase [Candidatus Scalindua sp.]
MRVFDFFVALIGILILSPFFIIAIFLIKLTSPGPILFIQDRVGRNNSIFRLYKFRSMVKNADRIGTSVTTGNDPRITKAGRILRKTKLDELPQLWNVLKGDMSFVGPRPEVPEIVNKYSYEMKRILDIRPGITSNATLYLRNEEDLLSLAKDHNKAYEKIFIPVKAKLAMEHVNRKSFLFDFGILLKTVWVLTGGKIWPIKEHQIINEIKQNIERLNNNKF